MTPQQKYYRSKKGKESRSRYRAGRGIVTDREYAWKRQGITLTYQEYLQMVEDCEGLCVLCTHDENSYRKTQRGIAGTLVVDHDHETGKIRGVLCNKHNRSLDQYVRCIPQLLKYLKINKI